MKIYPMETELFHAEGQVDRRMKRTKLIVAFCNFANASKSTYIHAHMRIRFQDPSFRTVRGSALLRTAALIDPLPVTTNTLMQTLIVTFLD